jgi:Gpi18-like mannosyltransferase
MVKKEELVFPLSVYILWRTLITSYVAFVEPVIDKTKHSDTLYKRFFSLLIYGWDGEHYTNIVQSGYKYPDQAFFPLWPLIIKLVTLTGIPQYVATVLLTTLFSITAVCLLYLLTTKLFGTAQAKKTLLLFCAFPSSFFLFANYTESLFLTLILATFICLENKSYYRAALFGALGTATRFTGIALTASFLCIKNLSLKTKLALIGISICGLFSYMLYLKITVNDPLLFKNAQEWWCNEHKINPKYVEFVCELKFPLITLLNFNSVITKRYMLPDYIIAIIFVGLLIPTYKHLKLEYFVFAATNLLIPLTYGRIVSMTRFALVIFPVFLILPLVLKNKAGYTLTLIYCGTVQVLFVTLFTNNVFVG